MTRCHLRMLASEFKVFLGVQFCPDSWQFRSLKAFVLLSCRGLKHYQTCVLSKTSDICANKILVRSTKVRRLTRHIMKKYSWTCNLGGQGTITGTVLCQCLKIFLPCWLIVQSIYFSCSYVLFCFVRALSCAQVSKLWSMFLGDRHANFHAGIPRFILFLRFLVACFPSTISCGGASNKPLKTVALEPMAYPVQSSYRSKEPNDLH